MAKKLTKAQLVSKLKKAGIPVPASAKMSEMEHRLEHWQGGDHHQITAKENAKQVEFG